MVIVRRRFFKDMPQIALDKKSNFEYLEKEVGLHKFLPKNVINNNKPKPLRDNNERFLALETLSYAFERFNLNLFISQGFYISL